MWPVSLLSLLLVASISGSTAFVPTRAEYQKPRKCSTTALHDARIPVLQLALDRMQKIQTQPLLPKVAVKVDTSSIPNAGKGLFALRNLKAGTILGYYPAHAIGFDRDDGDALYLTASQNDQEYFDGTNHTDYVQFIVGSRPVGETALGPGLFVDVNPSAEMADGWLAHYVNDGATVLSNTDAGILDYYQQTRERKNCVPIPFGPSPLLVSVTTRKVKKGEELFTSYGCMYWLETLLAEGEECTEISQQVQAEAQMAAKDLLKAMQQARAVHVDQETTLVNAFYDTVVA